MRIAFVGCALLGLLAACSGEAHDDEAAQSQSWAVGGEDAGQSDSKVSGNITSVVLEGRLGQGLQKYIAAKGLDPADHATLTGGVMLGKSFVTAPPANLLTSFSHALAVPAVSTVDASTEEAPGASKCVGCWTFLSKAWSAATPTATEKTLVVTLTQEALTALLKDLNIPATSLEGQVINGALILTEDFIGRMLAGNGSDAGPTTTVPLPSSATGVTVTQPH